MNPVLCVQNQYIVCNQIGCVSAIVVAVEKLFGWVISDVGCEIEIIEQGKIYQVKNITCYVHNLTNDQQRHRNNDYLIFIVRTMII